MKNGLSFLFALSVVAAALPIEAFVGETKAAAVHGSVRPDLCGGGFFSANAVRDVEYVGFFPSQEHAIEAGASISEKRFEVVVRDAATGGGWVVLAKYRELPALAAFEQDKVSMAALSKRLGSSGITAGCTSSTH